MTNNFLVIITIAGMINNFNKLFIKLGRILLLTEKRKKFIKTETFT